MSVEYHVRSFEPGLFTVGCTLSDGSWDPQSDHGSRDAAQEEAFFLNFGRKMHPEPAPTDGLPAAQWEAICKALGSVPPPWCGVSDLGRWWSDHAATVAAVGPLPPGIAGTPFAVNLAAFRRLIPPALCVSPLGPWDLFAAAYVAGYAIQAGAERWSDTSFAEAAGDFADAMMRERAKRNGGGR